MNKLKYFLPYATVEWLDNKVPYSPLFDDIYWSKYLSDHTSTVENQEPKTDTCSPEKKHVFIDANHIPRRLANLNEDEEFTILETGFGFGLNFLTTMEHWSGSSAKGTLQYLAFEQYPVDPADLKKLNKTLQNPRLEKLIAKYPPPVPGIHHIWLDNRTCLSLVFGDINTTLPDIIADVDACYLDGFSPSKNESIWNTDIYNNIAKLMRPGATCSSYSVAGHVRRGLRASGFEVEKTPGFGQKSQMLSALWHGKWTANKKPRLHTAIIGSGLSGIYCALALTRRNLPFTLYEKCNKPLGAVVDIAQLAVYPQLSVSPQKSSLISLQAFIFHKQHFKFNASGKLSILKTEQDLTHAKKLIQHFPNDILQIVNAERASELLGINTKYSALFLVDAGWLAPAELLQELETKIQYNNEIISFEHTQEGLILRDGAAKETKCDHVIITTGADDNPHLSKLNLVPVRGQSLLVKTHDALPKAIFADGVALFPQISKTDPSATFPSATLSATLSATFSRDDKGTDIRSTDNTSLLNSLNEFCDIKVAKAHGAVGIRMTTRDRMPVVGKLPDWPALSAFCALPDHKKKTKFNQYQKGIYCAVGFGSQGANLAPYCTEYLIREINHEPRCKPQQALAAIRFAFRDSGTKFK